MNVYLWWEHGSWMWIVDFKAKMSKGFGMIFGFLCFCLHILSFFLFPMKNNNKINEFFFLEA